MAIILGYTESELKRSTTARSREDLEAIITAANRAVALTDQLLAFAGLSNSGRSPIDANQAIRGVLETLDTSTHPAPALNLAFDQGNPWLPLDSAQFDHVVSNVLLNAIEAMAPGGTLTLTTAIQTIVAQESAETGLSPGEYVALSVADNGVGIPADSLEHVMEPFFTTKGPEHTGLGLATVRAVIDAAGGSVHVDSQADVGTTITITVPRVERLTSSAA